MVESKKIEIGSRWFVFHKGYFHQIIFLEDVNPNNMFVFLKGEKVRIYMDDLFESVPKAYDGEVVYLTES